MKIGVSATEAPPQVAHGETHGRLHVLDLERQQTRGCGAVSRQPQRHHVQPARWRRSSASACMLYGESVSPCSSSTAAGGAAGACSQVRFQLSGQVAGSLRLPRK